MRKLSLRAHFLIALGLGLLFRILTSWFVYGAQSLDDYRHGVWPAYSLWAGLPVDLPNYRSMLLVGMLKEWIGLGAQFGIQAPMAQVQWIYVLLSLISLTAIYGAYIFAKKISTPRFGILLLYLASLHALMPFVGTRAFGEAIACGFVLLGFALVYQEKKTMPLLLGFLTLGLAVLFRFQTGILYVSLVLLLMYERHWRAVAMASAAGLLILLAQLGIDFASGRAPLETLLSYFDANKNVSEYGVQPWFNTWLTALGFLLFPISAPLFVRLKNCYKQFRMILIPLFIFLLAHSLVPHKEERFLFPILGLLLVLLAYQWAMNWDSKFVRFFFTPVFVIVNSALLLLVTFNNSQASEFEPVRAVEQQFPSTAYFDLESVIGASNVHDYYVRPPSYIRATNIEELSASLIAQTLLENKVESVTVITSNPNFEKSLNQFLNYQDQMIQCGPLLKAQSFIDRVIYAGNPKNNQRRRPTWYVLCSKAER